MRLLGAKHIPTQSRTPDEMTTTTTMSHLMLLSHPCSPSVSNCIVFPHALAFNTPHWSQRFRFFDQQPCDCMRSHRLQNETPSIRFQARARATPLEAREHAGNESLSRPCLRRGCRGVVALCNSCRAGDGRRRHEIIAARHRRSSILLVGHEKQTELRFTHTAVAGGRGASLLGPVWVSEPYFGCEFQNNNSGN